MGFLIQGGRPDPTLEYDVTDAASGAPMRVTILGGVVAFAFDHGRFRVSSGGTAPRHPMGFFVPGAPVIAGPPPLIVPELFLTQVGVYVSDLKATQLHGVIELQAQIAPDPQRGNQPSIYLGFTCVGEDAMTLRYRVTLYRPR
jgi:hypothetical protein